MNLVIIDNRALNEKLIGDSKDIEYRYIQVARLLMKYQIEKEVKDEKKLEKLIIAHSSQTDDVDMEWNEVNAEGFKIFSRSFNFDKFAEKGENIDEFVSNVINCIHQLIPENKLSNTLILLDAVLCDFCDDSEKENGLELSKKFLDLLLSNDFNCHLVYYTSRRNDTLVDKYLKYYLELEEKKRKHYMSITFSNPTSVVYNIRSIII